jgi:hypothetical protein
MTLVYGSVCSGLDTNARESGRISFFVGLHQPADAKHFSLACISINRLRGRKKPISCPRVLVDSAAFTELNLHGTYRHDVEEYATELFRLHSTGVVRIAAAVAQDYMCEPFMLAKTGLTVDDHQRLTIERYDDLVASLDRLFDGACPFPVMPVLQGYDPADYVRHVAAYGDRLRDRMWVGVGSVCKRNGAPAKIVAVLECINAVRPDLALHGFGVKYTALEHPGVRALLTTADSMAWSFAARRQGRNANCWREALSFVASIESIDAGAMWQPSLFTAITCREIAA